MIFGVRVFDETKRKPCSPQFELLVSASIHNIFLLVIYLTLKIRTKFLVCPMKRPETTTSLVVRRSSGAHSGLFIDHLPLKFPWIFGEMHGVNLGCLFSPKAKKLLNTARLRQKGSGANLNELFLLMFGTIGASIKITTVAKNTLNTFNCINL